MSDRSNLWVIASGMTQRHHETTFGSRGGSVLASLHNICWDTTSDSFVLGNKHDLLWGKWRYEHFPCSKNRALAILTTCAKKVTRDFFYRDFLKTEESHELWSCDNSLVVIHKTATIRGSRREILQTGGLSLQFYSPDDGSPQLMSLPFSLTCSFLHKVKETPKEALVENLQLKENVAA